jgi:hypothetical protein
MTACCGAGSMPILQAYKLDKTLERLKVTLALACGVLLVVSFINSGRHTYPAGILVSAEPVQTPASPRSWEKNGYTITSLARYRIEAFVISTEPYWFDRGAELSPLDFAVGWGPLSDWAVLSRMSISQGGRWYKYSVRGSWPAPRDIVESHSANMHLIPADRQVERQLKSVHAADIVDLSGYLVEARGANGFKWRSSLTRTDTGAGACELMWVEEVSKRE